MKHRANNGSRRKPSKTRSTVELRLYVAGETPRSLAALANLRQFCSSQSPGKFHIEVIDLLKKPKLARGDQILAVPTLVRRLPTPMRKIIGDLSNREKLLIGLDLQDRETGA
jgi:circadian clock protein KaiB